MRRPKSFLSFSASHFNPRTHVGCDGLAIDKALSIAIFQSTHPRGVRPWQTWPPTSPRNFNPRTHVGCDVRRPMEKRGRAISIHAPTWGATFRCHKDKASPEIFQSTHPRGVRHSSLNMAATASDFNPRTHVGCDKESGAIYLSVNKFQSTHPRGVRRKVHYARIASVEFQSTHPRGVRPLGAAVMSNLFEFQSTHPRGVRRMSFRILTFSVNFNPRTHVGCDRMVKYLIGLCLIFQSTHPRGVRRL